MLDLFMKTRTFTSIITKVSIVLLLFVLTSFKGKESWIGINFTYPDAKVNSPMLEIFASYALKKQGIPINGSDAVRFLESIEKSSSGGVGMEGTLTVDEEYLTFEPYKVWSSLIGEGFTAFKVPLKDIKKVKRPESRWESEYIILETKKGDMFFGIVGWAILHLRVNGIATKIEENVAIAKARAKSKTKR